MTDQATRDAAADLIDKGMNLLRERGWCKGHLQDTLGRMCMAGGLRAADGQDLWRDLLHTPKGASAAFHLAFDTVVRESSVTYIAEFNDHPDTTLEDVLLVGKRAAHSLREVA